MIDLEGRLRELGHELDLADDGIVDDVLARLDEAGVDAAGVEAAGSSRRRAWLSAAAVVLVVIAALVAIPSSRQAIAEWFGWGGVTIERRPDVSVPADAPEIGSDGVSGPGEVIEVDGTLVLVGEIDVGAVDDADEPLLSKIATDGSTITSVDVDGLPGVWIDGDPHVLVYRTPDDEVQAERIAGNTLLWQEGDVIRRVEGFANLDAALAFATG